jgi:hypothetical protein
MDRRSRRSVSEVERIAERKAREQEMDRRRAAGG